MEEEPRRSGGWKRGGGVVLAGGEREKNWYTIMHWAKRRSGRRYGYRSRWIDGRCVKEYLGAGAEAEAATREDAELRRQRQSARRRWLATWSRIEDARRPVDDLCERAGLLTKGVLILAGYHLHKGHQWRRGKDHHHD